MAGGTNAHASHLARYDYPDGQGVLRSVVEHDAVLLKELRGHDQAH